MLTEASNKFGPEYDRLLREILLGGIEEKNARTGHAIKALPGGASFKIDLSDGMLPLASRRRLHPATAAAEVAWFLKGERDVTWLRQYCKIWDLFVEDDGVTVANAYGYRWRGHFGRDQLMHGVAALDKNPSDRRVYISAWDPSQDGLGQPSKNVPCPVGFTFSILADKLHSTYLLRSSDVFVGLPYDVMNHVMLMDAFAASFKTWNKDFPKPLDLGTLTVTMAHPHLYDSHYEQAEAYLQEYANLLGLPLLGWSMEEIEARPEAYVEYYKKCGAAYNWPTFNPRPEVIP